MLIIKKYHDYYDSAVGVDGIDKTCIYERLPVQESNQYEMGKIHELFKGDKVGWHCGPYSENYSKFRYNKPQKNDPYFIMPFIIGFCGKTYVGYVFKWDVYNDLDKIKIVYGPDEFFETQKFDATKKYSRYKTNYERTKKYFDRFHDKEHSDLFVKYHTPIWVYDFGTNIVKYENDGFKNNQFNYRNKYFMTNPPLNDYEFYRIFNTQMAFQEIQMYLQGVLGNKEKEIVVISEKDKLQQHGFDPKYSFRKTKNDNK